MLKILYRYGYKIKMNMTKIGARKIVILIIQRGSMIWDGWDTLWVRMNF